MRRFLLVPLVLVLACRIEHSSSGRPPGTSSDADSLLGVEADSTLRADVEATLREYYRSSGAREEFARRAPAGPGRLTVFSARMVHARIVGYGDLADAWVVYEARWGRPRDSVKTTRGIDAFHLYRHGAEWRIVSLASTTEQAGRPIAPPARRPVRRSSGATPAARAARRSSP